MRKIIHFAVGLFFALNISVGAIAGESVKSTADNTPITIAALSATPAQSTAPDTDVNVTKPCAVEKIDANGKLIRMAGCTEHAMPCMTDSDCCSGNCTSSACTE